MRRTRALLIIGAAALLLPSCKNYVLHLPFGLIVNAPAGSGEPLSDADLQPRITLPPGFSINTYAGGINNARMMRFTAAGDLLVSAPRDGTVYVVARDRNGDGYADGVRVLLDHLNAPHGLALHDGWLYIAEGDGVVRVRFDDASGQVTSAVQPVVAGLPVGGNHWTRTVGIGPDDALYVSIGSSCNACVDNNPRRAVIMRYALDGSGEQIYASGLRNAVGFAWQPGTGALYATDNGRDLLGDDFPPCELNRVEAGGFYGWPFANGNRVPDPDNGAGHEAEIAGSIPPAHEFGAHTAPLGITFYTGSAFPERYRGAAFVAQHGSWNRSQKSGYKVVALFFSDGEIREEDFATGFENDNDVIGRPVDVAEGPDGALYVSDDFTGSIYRIAYAQPAASGGQPAMRAPARVETETLAALSSAEREQASARGAALWQQHSCSTCHSPGQGTPAVRPLGGLASKFTLDTLGDFLRAPQPPMPRFDFTDAQRRDLEVYLLITYP